MLEIKQYQLFINGEWVDSSTCEHEEITSPAEESVVGTVQMGVEADAQWP